MEKLEETKEKTAQDGYYLLDLERTIGNGRAWYWKPHRRGYTDSVYHAGIYPEAEALEIALNDIDQRTVLIKERAVIKNMPKLY